MPSPQAQAHHARPPLRHLGRPPRGHQAEPEKSLTEGIKKSGGRNSKGRVTSRHRGGGAKRRYRRIDFKRMKDGVPAKVAAIEYDPNRSAYIALLHYADGEKRYILAPARLRRATRPVRRGRRHPGRATPCRCGPSPPARRSTTSSSRPAAAASSAARPARDPAGGQGGQATPRCACPRARCGWCRSSAAPRSARSATPSTRTSSSARRAAPATGQAPADARRGHEPGRPPARRRRGPPHPGRPSATPWGVPTLGYRTRKKRKRRPAHRPRPAARQEGQVTLMSHALQEGPVRRGAAAARASSR